MDAGYIGVSLWMNIGVTHRPTPLLDLIGPHWNIWLVVMTQYSQILFTKISFSAQTLPIFFTF